MQEHAAPPHIILDSLFTSGARYIQPRHSANIHIVDSSDSSCLVPSEKQNQFLGSRLTLT